MIALAWGVALIAAVAWPGRIIGPLDGAPFDVPVKVVVFAVVLPGLWVLYPRFLGTVTARTALAALLVWKLAAAAALPQAGWCGRVLTEYPDATDGYRLSPGWDVRTWGQGAPPSCSAIVARGYERLKQFPAWI